MVGLIDFSTDAASNDMAAPPILWVEGQPAKTINDSMRATMAALANWRDDNVGALGASRGGGDVYTVATSQGFLAASVARPHTLRFRVASANQTPASLSLDGLPAKPLLRARGRPGGPGDMAPDTVYACPTSPARARISSPRLRSSGPAGLSPRRMPRWSRDGFPVMDAPSRGQPIPRCSQSSARPGAMVTARPPSTFPICAAGRCSGPTTSAALQPTF